MKLVIYKETEYIEGVVKTDEDFKRWLKEHNKIRDIEDEEFENEFKLIDIEVLK